MTDTPTTRQAILEYFSEHQHATSGQLSRALQVTAADIRYHVGLLLKQGVLEVVSQRAKAGHGRPMRVYGLVYGAQPHNAVLLAEALLGSLPEPGMEEILRTAAQRMAGGDVPPRGGLTQRLIVAVARLNVLHYRARWEAHKTSPRIIFHHCPYRAIVDGHPEICILDRFLLSYLLHENVVQTVKLGLNAQQEDYCLFQVEMDQHG